MSSDETQIFNTLLPLLNPAFTVPRSPHMGELYLQPIGYPTTLLLSSLHHSGVIPRGFPGERLGAPFPFEQFRTLPDLCLWKAVKISFEPAASSLPCTRKRKTLPDLGFPWIRICTSWSTVKGPYICLGIWRFLSPSAGRSPCPWRHQP